MENQKEAETEKTVPDQEQESIYGSRLEEMEKVLRSLEKNVAQVREDLKQELGMDPIEHCLSRIKSEESMREKCRRRGLPETASSALEQIHDAIGLRIVAAFVNDVYAIRDRLLAQKDLQLVQEKDYIRHAKPNGYRSLHLIVRHSCGYYAEIQLRTISMDTWAALEHHLKYKKAVGENVPLIVAELKRCADELASTDLSLQTLRDMIQEAS